MVPTQSSKGRATTNKHTQLTIHTILIWNANYDSIWIQNKRPRNFENPSMSAQSKQTLAAHILIWSLPALTPLIVWGPHMTIFFVGPTLTHSYCNIQHVVLRIIYTSYYFLLNLSLFLLIHFSIHILILLFLSKWKYQSYYY